MFQTDSVDPQLEINRQQEVPNICDFRFTVEEELVFDEESGEESLRQIEYVEWRKRGKDDRTGDRVDRLKPNPLRGKEAAPEWPVIEKYYDAWKSGQEAEVDGTPLSEWRGINEKLVEVLKSKHQIHTLEQFGNARVDTINYPKIRQWQDACLKELKKRAAADELRQELAERDEMLAAMQARIEAMERDRAPMNQGEAVEIKQADVEFVEEAKPEPVKRKPGRPRKAA